MLRFVWLNAFIAIHTIVFCLGALILGTRDKSGERVHYRVAVRWARIILKVCGIRVDVRGRENVDPRVPRIYMTNHQSTFDIFALLAHLPVHFKFILKQELMRLPFLGPAMKRAGYIAIDREDPREAVKSIREAAEKIRNGASVVMFPEGTRSVDGRLQAFKRGGFNLALKSGCEIVPVSIKDSFRIVPKGSLRINRGSFRLTIGVPIGTSNYSKRTIVKLMERVRADMLTQLDDA